MGSASISAVCAKAVAVAALVTSLIIVGCSTPLDLDVDRSMVYNDGTVHPKRVSLLYYFGDSAYEAIFIDKTLMESIVIDTSSSTYRITIPQMATPMFSCTANWDYTPLVKGFGFSVDRQECDENVIDVVNRRTYVNVEMKHVDGRRADYLWFVDGSTKRMRVGFVASPENHLIKGRLIIHVVDPDRPRVLSYYGILTVEY
jgi:hypothetical protein